MATSFETQTVERSFFFSIIFGQIYLFSCYVKYLFIFIWKVPWMSLWQSLSWEFSLFTWIFPLNLFSTQISPRSKTAFINLSHRHTHSSYCFGKKNININPCRSILYSHYRFKARSVFQKYHGCLQWLIKYFVLSVFLPFIPNNPPGSLFCLQALWGSLMYAWLIASFTPAMQRTQRATCP